MARKRKRSFAPGCPFWICLVVVVIAVAIAARKPIQDTFNKVIHRQDAKPEVVMKPLPQAPAQPEAGSQTSLSPSGPDTPTVTTLTIGSQPPEAQTGSHTENQGVTAQSPPEKPATRKARLFFVQIDAEGSLVLKSVIRTVPGGDSPLKDALQALLAGPTSEEVNMGFLSMIPTGTQLRDVIVRGDTAYVDFSDNFRFGTLGKEGLDAQVRQVVFAATEFPSVKKVQILIEGKKVQYLGPEGTRVDTPMGRDSFNK